MGVTKKTHLFILFLVFGLFMPLQSHAQEIFEHLKKPLPKIELLPKEEWEENSVLYEEVPFDDEDMAYKIRLPKKWEKVTDGGMSTFQVSNKVLGEVARYYSPAHIGGERSSLSIKILELDYQQTADQWFLQYLLMRGYNVQGLDIYNENQVEALYVLINDEISYIVRAYVQIVGTRIILSEYYMPLDYWSEDKVLQAQVVSSFKFQTRDRGIVEDMNKYLFLDIAEMQYPSSWELRAPVLRSIDYMGVELLNVSSLKADGKHLALDGKIDINLVSVFVGDSLEEELSNIRESISEQGLVLGDPIENTEVYNFNDLFNTARVEVFSAKSKDKKMLGYEVWFSIMATDDYYYFLTLLTPSRDDDYYMWVRNTQTFRVITEQMTPLDESIITR